MTVFFYKLLYYIPGPVPSRESITTSTYLLTYLQREHAEILTRIKRVLKRWISAYKIVL